MKLTLSKKHNLRGPTLVVAAFLACGGGLLLAQPGPDAIGEHLFPPELIKQAHQALELTPEQEASLREAVEATREPLADLHEQMKVQAAKMADLVKGEKLDEAAVLRQADKVMKLEHDIKQLQLSLLIKIKNTLTAEQQAKLRELKGRLDGLQRKLREAKDLTEQWKREGRDLAPFEDKRPEFEALMREGRIPEAEALLDELLRALRSPRERRAGEKRD
jgi:Spy/CpxP family protein refolding chaperone